MVEPAGSGTVPRDEPGVPSSLRDQRVAAAPSNVRPIQSSDWPRTSAKVAAIATDRIFVVVVVVRKRAPFLRFKNFCNFKNQEMHIFPSGERDPAD